MDSGAFFILFSDTPEVQLGAWQRPARHLPAEAEGSPSEVNANLRKKQKSSEQELVRYQKAAKGLPTSSQL